MHLPEAGEPEVMMAVPQASRNNEGSVEAPERLRFAGFTLDPAGHTLVDANGQDVPLWRSEFALLLALVRRSGRVQSRDHLLEAVAGRSQEPFDRSIDVLIGRLRKKLEPDPKAPRLIVTVAGTGYKFTGRVQTVQDDGLELARPEKEQSAGPRSPERRQLTVMLCGLATPLSGRLDPEDLHHVVTAFHKACTAVITQCGGVVGQIRSDGILAYFGYPQAHEHDAEHAVRAGLGVIEATAKLKVGLLAALTARVGIATGSVIAGDLLGDEAMREHAVFGEAPELAAELLSNAEPGSVMISGSTRRLAGGLFDYRAIAPIPLNGTHELAQVFQVLGEATVTSRFEALHEGNLTPLVGREEEIALLLRRWERARAGAGRTVHITGEPGIGKSRLVRALRTRLAGEVHRPMAYSCSPLHQGTAFHPFIHMLERAADFYRSDKTEDRLAKLEAWLRHMIATPEAALLLADLLSIPSDGRRPPLNLSPRQQREKTLEAWIAQPLEAARHAPVLLIFEDVHWIDPTSLEVLEALIERVRDHAVLVIITSRPEFVPAWPSHVQAETMVLNRLDDDDVMQMAVEVSSRTLPAELCHSIAERADGVPLFVEELTKTVLESSYLPQAVDSNTLSGPLPQLSLPTSLRDSLMARLDRLSAAKEVAQIGAVIGRSFPHDLIGALTSQPEPALGHALDQLVASGLASRRGVSPHATYTFKHALVQDAAYESLLKSQRAAIHRRIVEVLIAQEPGIEDVQSDLLAQHCERAGLITRAADYGTRAGWRSVKRCAFPEARRQFGDALRVVATLSEGEERDQSEMRALSGLETVEFYTSGYASTARGRVLDRLSEICARLGEPEEFLSCTYSTWDYRISRGDIPGAFRAAEALSQWGERCGNVQGRILGLVTAGLTYGMRADLANARSCLEQALQLDETRQDDRTVDQERAGFMRSSWIRGLVQFYLKMPANANAGRSAPSANQCGTFG